MKEVIFYKDINNEGQRIYNEQALLNYIDNILFTKVGTRPFNRAFGSFLEKYLFDVPSETTILQIKLEIERAIYRWLDDVEISEIDINYDSRKLYIFVGIYSKKLKNTIIYEKEIDLVK